MEHDKEVTGAEVRAGLAGLVMFFLLAGGVGYLIYWLVFESGPWWPS